MNDACMVSGLNRCVTYCTVEEGGGSVVSSILKC